MSSRLHYWPQLSLLLPQSFCHDLIMCGIYILSVDIELEYVTCHSWRWADPSDASFRPGPQRSHIFLLSVLPLPASSEDWPWLASWSQEDTVQRCPHGHNLEQLNPICPQILCYAPISVTNTSCERKNYIELVLVQHLLFSVNKLLTTSF